MARTPECPRCGYDLSGMAGPWQEACPMQGICSECGLSFMWGDVLSLQRTGPRWFFESGERASARRLMLTLLRVPRATVFWRRVSMEQPIRRRRLAVVMALTLIVMHVCIAAVGVVIIANELRSVMIWTNWPAATTPMWSEVVSTYWRELVSAALWPYSIDIDSGWSGRIWQWGFAGTTPGGPALGGVAVFAVMVPAAFFVLGDTLRRCRVRRVHFLRGFAWSLPVPAGTAALTAALLLVHPIQGLAWIGAGLSILWLSVYWHMFTARYLRLPHALGVSASMLTIGLLTAAIVQLWFGSLVWHLV